MGSVCIYLVLIVFGLVYNKAEHHGRGMHRIVGLLHCKSEAERNRDQSQGPDKFFKGMHMMIDVLLLLRVHSMMN